MSASNAVTVSRSLAGHQLVLNAFRNAGFQAATTGPFAVQWTRKHVPPAHLGVLQSWQRVNHIPGSWHLSRKDLLGDVLRRARARHDDAFSFFPRSYLLPRDAKELGARFAEMPQSRPDAGTDAGTAGPQDPPPFILKPIASSCGRGISLVRSPTQIPTNKACVVQDYVPNPLLIRGLKFDLRLYVLVTCFRPLSAFLYTDGLVRFATEQYSDCHDSGDERARFGHLTNYSIQKHRPGFQRPTAEEDAGSKWSWRALRQHFRHNNINDEGCVEGIQDLVVKTLVASDALMGPLVRLAPSPRSCFEVYGFDVMLDDALRPWLIEVNLCPSLSADSPVDVRVKNGMLRDVVSILGAGQDTDHTTWEGLVQAMDREDAARGSFQRIFPRRNKEGMLQYFEDPEGARVNGLALQWAQSQRAEGSDVPRCEAQG